MANEVSQQTTETKTQRTEKLISLLHLLETKMARVEKIILAQSDNPHPFEKQLLERLDELSAWQASMEVLMIEINSRQPATSEKIVELRAEIQAEFAASHKQLAAFIDEARINFKKASRMIEILNSDILNIRVNHRFLEKILLPLGELEEEDDEFGP